MRVPTPRPARPRITHEMAHLVVTRQRRRRDKAAFVEAVRRDPIVEVRLRRQREIQLAPRQLNLHALVHDIAARGDVARGDAETLTPGCQFGSGWDRLDSEAMALKPLCATA